MPTDLLFDIVTRACIKNFKRINDVGEISYKLVRPILLKIESPEQLYKLECQSPQLIGADAELWLNFMRRDVPGFESKPHQPADPKNWYKVYLKLKRESENDMTRGEEQLLASLNKIQEEKASKVAEIKDWKKMPRIPRMASDNTFLKPRVSQKLLGRPDPPTESPSRKTKASTLMEKIKKEARGARAARTTAANLISQARTSSNYQVNRSPQQTLDEIRKAEAEKIRAEQKKPSTSPEQDTKLQSRTPRSVVRPLSVSDREMLNRETRLRAIAAGKAGQTLPSAKHVKLTSDDFDNDIELKASTAEEQVKARLSSSPNLLAADKTAAVPGRVRVSPTLMPTPIRAPRAPGIGLDGRPRTISPPGRPSTPTIAPAARVLKRKGADSIFMAPQKRMKGPPMPIGRA